MDKTKKKTIGFCTMEKFDNRPKDSVGSSRIRARWLIPYWKEAEEFVIGKGYDVMIFQKVYWKKMMEEFKGVKILDLCDPDWLEGKPVFDYIDLADAVVTSTEALAEYIKKLRPSRSDFILCIPDRVYLPEHVPVKKKHEGKAKSVVWFGYHHNTHYLYKTFNELISKGLKLTIIADKPFTPTAGYSNLKVKNVPFSYPGIHKEVVKHDMVLMPKPIEDERGKFKSNNKILQAWAIGMPVVIEPQDLEKFMSGKEREKERVKRLKEVKEKHDVRISVQEYKDLIKRIRVFKKK